MTKKFNLFEIVFFWISLVLVITINVITNYNNFNIMVLLKIVVFITSLLSVMYSAKGTKEAYYYGIIYTFGYIFIVFSNKLYGSMIITLIYTLPMQFIGLYNWQKNLQKDKEVIKVRSLNSKQYLIYSVATIISIVIYRYLLVFLSGNQTWLDSTVSAMAIVATFLMAQRYKEQWILWIITNVLGIIMWINQRDIVMAMTWTALFINSIYGYIVWNKEEKNIKE